MCGWATSEATYIHGGILTFLILIHNFGDSGETACVCDEIMDGILFNLLSHSVLQHMIYISDPLLSAMMRWQSMTSQQC